MRIHLHNNAPPSVSHAANRLAQYTGISVREGTTDGPSIHLRLNDKENTDIGEQGYTIHGQTGADISIRGNHYEGVANGAYTFLRTIMCERRTNPFSRAWDICETPQFSIRSMIIAPYRFGASYGFASLSPDRWGIDEWKEHIDFMRLCNMTTVCLASMRMYHPDYPQSHREKWRYEVWKQVMDYCHEVGMKFNWFISPNLVCEQAYWDNPDLRAKQDKASWNGNGLIWHEAKDIILENQRHTLEFFKDLDALEIIYSDGGGFSFDEHTGSDPAGYFADATKSYMELLREVGSDAELVFWNWNLEFWAKILLPLDEIAKYPKYKTIQDDVLPLLPKNIQWVDASMLTWIQNYGQFVQTRGNPPLREGLLIGKENGFGPVIDLFWFMNPEYSINIFPHPYIKRAIQEAAYARDEIDADGVMGYRLAPPCRFIGDYTFFRLASDPTLTQEQIVGELAGLLCADPGNQKKVTSAINSLETFWSTLDIADIENAETIFRELLETEDSKQLEYISHGTTFLTDIVKLAQPDLSEDDLLAGKAELYQKAKGMYIFQGLTSDIVWTPEAVRFFHARVDMMIHDFQHPLGRECPFPETVDRSIYPKATSDPVKLNWKDTKDNYKMDFRDIMNIAKMTGTI